MLMAFDKVLNTPAMGLPDLSPEEIVQLQDTSTWAHDPFTGARGASYSSPQHARDIKWALGAYNNPQQIYNSPVIHTVVLSSLVPGRT